MCAQGRQKMGDLVTYLAMVEKLSGEYPLAPWRRPHSLRPLRSPKFYPPSNCAGTEVPFRVATNQMSTNPGAGFDSIR